MSLLLPQKAHNKEGPGQKHKQTSTSHAILKILTSTFKTTGMYSETCCTRVYTWRVGVISDGRYFGWALLHIGVLRLHARNTILGVMWWYYASVRMELPIRINTVVVHVVGKHALSVYAPDTICKTRLAIDSTTRTTMVAAHHLKQTHRDQNNAIKWNIITQSRHWSC